MDIGKCGLAQLGAHRTSDIYEVADRTVVHERVASEHKRMIVDGRDGRTRCGTNVAETHPRLRVAADRSEVHIVEWRLHGLVECRPQTLLYDLESVR